MSVWAYGFKHWTDLLQSISFCYACGNLWPSLGSGSMSRLGPKSFAHTLEVLASFSFLSFFPSCLLFLCFLIWQDISSSFCTAFAQPWNHLFLQAALSSFSMKWYLKTIVWVLEKAVAPHSSTFAWKIPWTEEPGRLQSMGLLRVRHDLATSLSLFTFTHWRREWQPSPVFLPGESQGQGSLVGCCLCCHTESDMTEAT